MADNLIGKTAHVTGRIVGTSQLGEVMVSIRGGTETYYAYATDDAEVPVGTQVTIIDEAPGRTVIVSA